MLPMSRNTLESPLATTVAVTPVAVMARANQGERGKIGEMRACPIGWGGRRRSLQKHAASHSASASAAIRSLSQPWRPDRAEPWPPTARPRCDPSDPLGHLLCLSGALDCPHPLLARPLCRRLLGPFLVPFSFPCRVGLRVPVGCWGVAVAVAVEARRSFDGGGVIAAVCAMDADQSWRDALSK